MIALSQKFVQRVARFGSGLYDQTLSFNREINGCSGLELQEIQNGGRDRQHGGTADLPQICRIHINIIHKYNFAAGQHRISAPFGADLGADYSLGAPEYLFFL